MFEKMFEEMIQMYINNKVKEEIDKFYIELKEQLDKNLFPKDIAIGVKTLLNVIKGSDRGIKDHD